MLQTTSSRELYFTGNLYTIENEFLAPPTLQSEKRASHKSHTLKSMSYDRYTYDPYLTSLNDKHYSSTSAQEQRERGDFKEDERAIGTKVIEPIKGRGLPVCEHEARGGDSRPLYLRHVDTIYFKLNKIGLQNDGDRHNTLPLIACNEKPEVKSNPCQGINIYRAINAYKPNSTIIKFSSALSRRGQARPKLCPACH